MPHCCKIAFSFWLKCVTCPYRSTPHYSLCTYCTYCSCCTCTRSCDCQSLCTLTLYQGQDLFRCGWDLWSQCVCSVLFMWGVSENVGTQDFLAKISHVRRPMPTVSCSAPHTSETNAFEAANMPSNSPSRNLGRKGSDGITLAWTGVCVCGRNMVCVAVQSMEAV